MAAKKPKSKKNLPQVDERGLMETKWFEYRAYSPYLANLMFLREYAKARQSWHESQGKHFINVLSKVPRDYSKWSLWNTLTRLRVWADKHAMRYDLFWRFAFQTLDEMNLQHPYIQVFTSKKILPVIMRKWDEHCDNFLVYSDAKMFQVSNYTGTEIQDDYFWYLVGSMKQHYSASQVVRKIANAVKNHKIPRVFFDKHVKSQIS